MRPLVVCAGKQGAQTRDILGHRRSEQLVFQGAAGKKIAGTDPRPSLFDNALAPKPAFPAVLKAIEDAPNRFDLMTVREAQEALTKLGFVPGVIDGKWGRKCLAALNRFFLGEGLFETNSLDIPSQKALSKAVGE